MKLKDLFNKKPKNDIEIVKSFYNEYGRIPRVEEFKALGGHMRSVQNTYGSYQKFLKSLGLPCIVTKAESFELIHIRRNKVVMVGTRKDIREYLGVSKQLVAELVKLPDFPCVKFKRRILINKLGINDWMTKNIGNFIKY